VTGDDLFHFDSEKPNFEVLARENGFRFWLASDLASALGMAGAASLSKAVNRAMAASTNLGIPIEENFSAVRDGANKDFKLSRFACYLTVMNADPRNPRVAQAQGWFAAAADHLMKVALEADAVDRVVVRGEISEREKTLSTTAFSHGVEQFQLFQNAGYRGLYNMNFAELRDLKGIPAGRSPLDFMGSDELAANLFRITQTDAKIKNEQLYGQRKLEAAARSVGREVRDTMIRISGTRPEELPVAEDIKKVRSSLKGVRKGMAKLDKPRKG
jgi:DNA-damage-inducible protein D